jgi:hypothetical protein
MIPIIAHVKESNALNNEPDFSVLVHVLFIKHGFLRLEIWGRFSVETHGVLLEEPAKRKWNVNGKGDAKMGGRGGGGCRGCAHFR